MKTTKRLTAMLLSIILLVGIFAAATPKAQAAISTSTFQTKVKEFISDSRWKSGIPWADEQRPKLSSYSSKGCCAYAADFAAYVYGATKYAWNNSTFTQFTNLNEIRAGDIIQTSTHWFVVLERNGNTFRTAEGNLDDKTRVCSDGWGIKNGKLYNLKVSNGARTFVYGYHYNFSDGGPSSGGTPSGSSTVTNSSLFTNVWADGITETDANINASLPYASYSDYGFYVGTSSSSLEKHSETEKSTLSKCEKIFYGMKKWYKTLTPGTTYYYKLYAVTGGVEHQTALKTFTTKSHTWNSGTVIKEPTATTTGTKKYTCTGCGATKQETIPVIEDNTPDEDIVAVKINRQPVSVSVANGETAKVSVSATGDGLTYRWYYKNAGQSKFSQSVFAGNNYSVTMDSSSNKRQVYCVVTDKYGNSVQSNTVTLYVSTFPDVPNTMWCYEAVEYVAEKGYITGYKSGNFGPADKITRQDFVVVLARLSGVDLKKYSGRTNFPDVQAGSYYEAAVKWASANGIVNGYNNGEFGVGDSITREQLVTILYSYAKKTGCDMSVPASASTKLNSYTDAYKITGYAKNAVIWALHNGLISGMTSTTIAPQNTASRGQAATILMNLCKKFYE